MCIPLLPQTFVWNIFNSDKSLYSCTHKHMQIFMESAHFCCTILTKTQNVAELPHPSKSLQIPISSQVYMNRQTAGETVTHSEADSHLLLQTYQILVYGLKKNITY
jgi:hypothetical protein